ncbi:MAG TPA: hypothetical protein VFJ51_11020 [Nitrososphaeraceae archaeon]|nr:hypothetical protein [Nitrososphaeraceae archaeon]
MNSDDHLNDNSNVLFINNALNSDNLPIFMLSGITKFQLLGVPVLLEFVIHNNIIKGTKETITYSSTKSLPASIMQVINTPKRIL